MGVCSTSAPYARYIRSTYISEQPGPNVTKLLQWGIGVRLTQLLDIMNMYMYINKCMYIHTHILCVCIYIYIYIHLFIYISRSLLGVLADPHSALQPGGTMWDVVQKHQQVPIDYDVMFLDAIEP